MYWEKHSLVRLMADTSSDVSRVMMTMTMTMIKIVQYYCCCCALPPSLATAAAVATMMVCFMRVVEIWKSRRYSEDQGCAEPTQQLQDRASKLQH